MRYSGIEIPVFGDYHQLALVDYEYVDKFTLHSTKGDLGAFKAKELGSIKYEGALEGGIEVFKYTTQGQRNQVMVMDKFIFIPESHPLFNTYVIYQFGLRIFTNSKSRQPDMSYNEMNRAIKQSVFKNLKL